MFLSQSFMYNGINSELMGVAIARTENGMIEMPFGHRREIVEEKLDKKETPYFYGFSNECLMLSITLCKLDGSSWTYEDRRKIVEWFYQEEYKPFISLDNPEVIYYCTAVGEPKRYDNGFEEGYVTLNLKCNSPYAYSPMYINTYDYKISKTNILEIDNTTNVKKYYYPEIEIEMVNGTEISIINLTNKGEEFKFTNLKKGEIIYINNDMQEIESSLKDTWRLSNFNKNWLKLVKGVNRLKINGNVKVAIRCCYPISI